MAAGKTGWWLKICVQRSNAGFVKFDIGRGGDDGSHRRWLDWQPEGEPFVAEYDAPADLVSADEIWWGVEPYGHVVASLMWQGHCVQTARCSSREEYEKHQGDEDNSDC